MKSIRVFLNSINPLNKDENNKYHNVCIVNRHIEFAACRVRVVFRQTTRRGYVRTAVTGTRTDNN